MFDDETITYNLAVVLRTMDIQLSSDHEAKLREEGYYSDHIDEGVADSLLEQIEELQEDKDDTDEQISALSNWSASLNFDLEQFSARLEEFSNR